MYFGETFQVKNSSYSDMGKKVSCSKILPSINFPENKAFDHCEPFHEGIARVANGDKFNYIKKDIAKRTLKVISKEWFSAAEKEFRKEGFAVVQLAKDKSWNFLKTDGKLAFKESFKKICVVFSNGLAIAQKYDGKYVIVRPAYSMSIRKAYFSYVCSLDNGNSFLVEDIDRKNHIYNILLKKGDYKYDEWFDLSPTADFEYIDESTFKFLRAERKDNLFNLFKPNGKMLYEEWLTGVQDFFPEDDYIYIRKKDYLWYVTNKQGRVITKEGVYYLDYIASDDFSSSRIFAYIENEHGDWNIMRIRDSQIINEKWVQKKLDRFNCYITKVAYRVYSLVTFDGEIIIDRIIN